MNFETTGRVLGHVGEHAIVQLEGGLLPVRDANLVLTPGAGALVSVSELDDSSTCAALASCTAFSVQQQGRVALLFPPSGDGSPVALLLSQTWPRMALVRVSTPSPELDEGTGPNGSAQSRGRTTPRIRIP